LFRGVDNASPLTKKFDLIYW